MTIVMNPRDQLMDTNKENGADHPFGSELVLHHGQAHERAQHGGDGSDDNGNFETEDESVSEFGVFEGVGPT